MRDAPQRTHQGGAEGSRCTLSPGWGRWVLMWTAAKHAFRHDNQEQLNIRRKDTLDIYAQHARMHVHMMGGFGVPWYIGAPKTFNI